VTDSNQSKGRKSTSPKITRITGNLKEAAFEAAPKRSSDVKKSKTK